MLPATVFSDGTVRTYLRGVGEYTCDMNIVPYPYDEHTCSFDVATAALANEVQLVGDLGYNVADGPEGFDDPEAETVKHVRTVDASTGAETSRVEFVVVFTRKPDYVVSTYILVGWALNMLGFLVFWVPVEGTNIDRSGLAVTTILAAQFMMYDAKITLESTWLDSYFSLMFVFQMAAFVLTVYGSRTSRMILALGGDGDYLDKVYRRQRDPASNERTTAACSFARAWNVTQVPKIDPAVLPSS